MIELGLDRNREESMANRYIQQKILKNKRRGRYAVFSGNTTRFTTERVDRGKYQDVNVTNPGTAEEDMVPTGKHIVVYAGEVSLSKQVINTGRGPDKERMQEYYQRVHSYDQALPITLGLTQPMAELLLRYDDIVKNTPREMRIRLVDNITGTLDLYFNLTQFFFVDVDYQKRFIRRSTVYPTKKRALDALKDKRVRWVETISSPKKAPKFERIGSGNPVAPPKS
jgi:hypothetical protein